MTTAALIVAGGLGKRFKSKTPKQFHIFNKDYVINHSIKKFLSIKEISKIIIAIDVKKYKEYAPFLIKNNKICLINSGKTRFLSVKNGLNYLKNKKIKNVLIHDAVRPYLSKRIIKDQLKFLKKNKVVIPVINPTDTIAFNKKIIPRNKVFQIQTPQAFDYKSIYKLHLKNKNINVSDDSSLFYKEKIKVKFIKGDIENKKITFVKDLPNKYFYGIGYDIHKMVKGRKLIVGGIKIPSKMGPLGHSDGDSLFHALIDSFLGAAKKGDIGTLYPNTKKYKDIKSTKLLKNTMSLLKKKNFEIDSIDLNIILQSPNLSKYKKKIKNNISKLCKIDLDKINIKAKTTDRLGIIGKNKGLACEVISVLRNVK